MALAAAGRLIHPFHVKHDDRGEPVSTAEIEPTPLPAPAATGRLHITLQSPPGHAVAFGQTSSAYLADGVAGVELALYRADGMIIGTVHMSDATPEQVAQHDGVRRARDAARAAAGVGAARTMGVTVVR